MRYARENDFNQIIQLFKDCFPEDAEFTDWFFKNQFSIKDTLIYDIDNKVVAMLQLLPYNIDIDGKSLEVYYIYGACTHIDYRNRGYMSQMLKSIDKDTILIPASDSLYEFYGSAGFETVFYNYKSDIHIDNTINDDIHNELYITDDVSIKDMLKIYDKPNRIIRDELYFDKQSNLIKYLGGELLYIKQDNNILGYAFIYENENYIEINEIICENKQIFDDFIQKISHKYKKNHIKYTSDAFGDKTRIGMIKTKHKINDIYMNLMFN